MLSFLISFIILAVLISEILADPWISSVIIPACEPDKLMTFLSKDFIDIAKSVDETSSPVDNKISFSLKSGGLFKKVTSLDILTNSSVVLPIADTTTTG